MYLKVFDFSGKTFRVLPWGYFADGQIKQGVITVNNGIISSFEQTGEADLKVPYYFYPVLADGHLHLNLMDNSELTLPEIMAKLTGNGILGFRECGDRSEFWKTAKDQCSYVKGVFCGNGLYKEGYYGRIAGIAVKDIRDALREISRLYEEGAKFIKVFVTGLVSLKEKGKVGATGFSLEELKEIVDTAHKLGLMVSAHANGPEGIETSIEAGVDTLEHGYYITDELLIKMRDAGTWWVPTVAAIRNQMYREELSPTERENAYFVYKEQLFMVKRAFELGVKLGLGTDSGTSFLAFGEAVWEEMELYLKAGIPPGEVIKIAGENNFQMMGISGFSGIKPGNFAKFIGLKIPFGDEV
ncbi:hypothetical protein ciss_05130 [Carboxydothermus islandicus]|uniref:Amidohydrolase-related domain-containing protein n=1 Tax=Carboxydothermus islandicus TaxID=661089 RepID=A0A1L8D077_9THEO|nr:amidohydrolase family protein [Carboxydothermus islandicus]GAV24580.1 hypothetical protein ciss_05130 [Carboxydothermus islandicus]